MVIINIYKKGKREHNGMNWLMNWEWIGYDLPN